MTQWLSGMRQQLASNHGNIGDSLAAVEKLSGEHEKFSETAKVSDMSCLSPTRALQAQAQICFMTVS